MKPLKFAPGVKEGVADGMREAALQLAVAKRRERIEALFVEEPQDWAAAGNELHEILADVFGVLQERPADPFADSPWRAA
jgi:hypothetical protein